MEKEISEKLESASDFYYEDDFEKAYEIFNELVKKYDNNDAKFYIAKMYLKGEGVEQNYKKAFEIFNELDGKFNDDYDIVKAYLARMYYEGKGVEQNYEKAFEIFNKILENRNEGYVYTDIEMYIAEMYYDGRGVEQNYEKAFEIFNELVETDDDYDVAKSYLVRMYYDGKGVEQNYEKAYEIFKMFIDTFHIYYEEDDEDYYCTYNGIGKNIENYEKAFEIFNELAEKYDDKEAKLYIARMYYYGENVEQNYVEQNYEKAYVIFNELVEKYNNIEAKMYIARMYYKGIYLEQNYKKAYEVFKALAEKYDDEVAKLYLFKMYYYGEGVEQNYEKGYDIAREIAPKLDYEKYKDRWKKYSITNKYQWGRYLEKNYEGIYEIILELAEIYGNEDSKLNVAKVYYTGIDTEQNYEKAFKIFSELAGEKDNKEAKFYIGRMYYYGEYVEENNEKAYEIFNELVEKYDNKDAKFYMGRMYYYGEYVEENNKKAYEIFNELVEKYDNNNAKFYIAEMYYYGRYVEQNYEKAYEIFNELAEQYDDEDAKSYIAIMNNESEINTNAQKELNLSNEDDYEDNWKSGITTRDNNKTNDIPGIPITDKDREIKLLEYSDLELAKKEEEEYYKKEDDSYFARIDTDIEYNEKKYYKKFYITKDSVKEKVERGIVDSVGNYITPSELREMGRSGLITVEERERGVFKEYDDGTTLIHWSAPLTNLYYNKENNSIKINEYIYNTMLKRNFSFNPFKFYNSYIAENEFYKDGTVDEFLIKVLLDKKESNNLTDIIYTIQEKQNRIIRADAMKSFIVQGCAGSGKTMILLHRLSYLKFNNKLPNYDKIKIITPNPLFADFIKDLVKDLNVEEIEQMTISDYYLLLNQLYLNRYNKMEQIENKFYLIKKEKFKKQFSTENMVDEHLILNNKIYAIYSENLISIIEQEYNKLITAINDEIKENGLDINEKYQKNKTYYEQIIKYINLEIKKLQKVIDNNRLDIQNINIRLDDINKTESKLEEKMNRISLDIQNNYKEYEKLKNKKDKEINKKKRVFNKIRNNMIFQKYEDMMQSKMKEINILKESQFEIEKKQKENTLKKNEVISKLEKYQNNNNLLNDKINRYKSVENDILDNAYFTIDIYEKVQSKIRDKYNIQIDKKQYLKIDLLIYLYINYIHIGEIINGDNLLCIDEAQDYSLIEYEILNMINNKVVMNLYGDINQSIYDEGIYSWEELKNKLKCQMYILNENYRNPIEITKFCNEKFNYDILEMGLSTRNVDEIKKNQINEIINKKIKEGKSIAVITKENLEEKINNQLVRYCNVQETKGFEYNTVIVNDKDMSENEKYIAYTRALSELYILTAEEEIEKA